MNKLLAKLPPHVLPFVTRSLRGGRGKRYLLFSLLIAAATLLFGLWVALGSGQFEQGLRVDLELERDEWDRQYEEFVVITHSAGEYYDAGRDADRLRDNGLRVDMVNYGKVRMVADQGLDFVSLAARTPTYDRRDEPLRNRASALLRSYDGSYGYLNQDNYDQGYRHDEFRWGDERERDRLERIIALGGVPEVVRYESPLSLRDAWMVVGFLAGLALAACVTVFAPLLVGIQQAQEQHENTLMPLTGTGLRARQLILGLASGPAFVVAIFAIPQLVLFLGGAALAGEVPMAAATVAALLATGVFVTFAAQLIGHLVGPKRTPGIVAISLMGLLGVSWLAGSGLAMDIARDTAGLAAVMPTMGLAVLLGKSFGAFVSGHADFTLLATLIWSCAALLLAGLIMTVLARKLEGRQGAPLGPLGALLGALTCIVLLNVAMPDTSFEREPLRMYLGIAGLALPFAVLLMSRVPTGDNPTKLRRLPVATLLLELAGWFALQIIVAAAFGQVDGQAFHPIALLWLGWSMAVLGLMAIRTVALPANVAAYLFLGFCSASLIVGFVQSVFWAFESHHELADVFAATHLGALLGLIQIAVTVAIPVLLLRNLRKNFGSLSSR